MQLICLKAKRIRLTELVFQNLNKGVTKTGANWGICLCIYSFINFTSFLCAFISTEIRFESKLSEAYGFIPNCDLSSKANQNMGDFDYNYTDNYNADSERSTKQVQCLFFFLNLIWFINDFWKKNFFWQVSSTGGLCPFASDLLTIILWNMCLKPHWISFIYLKWEKQVWRIF